MKRSEIGLVAKICLKDCLETGMVARKKYSENKVAFTY
jgi:hypothetical protein